MQGRDYVGLYRSYTGLKGGHKRLDGVYGAGTVKAAGIKAAMICN